MRANRKLTEADVTAFLIGFAPFIVLLLTLDTADSYPWTSRIREHSLPILAVEGVVVGLAFISGLPGWLRCAPSALRFAFSAWLVVAFGAALFVAGSARSVSLTCIWVLHGLFAASVTYLHGERKLESSGLASALLWGFVVYAISLATVSVWLDADPEFAGTVSNWVSRVPGIGNLRRVAAFATGVAALSIGLALYTRSALAIVAASLAFFTAFWTGSRATAVAVAAAVFAAAILFSGARKSRLAALYLATALTGFVLAVAFPVEAGSGNDELRAFAETGDNGRLRLWAESMDAISRSPLIGYGEGQTAFVLPDDPLRVEDFKAHPHNLFLQILIAWGFLGAAFVVVIGIWLARIMYRAGRSPSGFPFVLGALGLAAHSMIDGALYDVAPVFLFSVFVGAACANRSCPDGEISSIPEPSPELARQK